MAAVSTTHTYQGVSHIEFFIDDKDALAVAIDTERLHIRPVASGDLDSYAALYGDKDVMGKFATGETKDRAYVENRINNCWVKRWSQKDPYSALAAVKNDGTDDFVAHVVLGHGDEAGSSELAYFVTKHLWSQGYGKEAVQSVVEEYAPATVKEGYLLEGKALTKITATARPDNPASVKILEKVGMVKVGEEEKYGALRYNYALDLKV